MASCCGSCSTSISCIVANCGWIRSISSASASACGTGQVCTFRDCLGMFIAIAPDGGLFPCQRFCAHPEWRMGMLADHPTLFTLLASPVARRFAAREARVSEDCAKCAHLDYCRGGCPYNAWAGGHANACATRCAQRIAKSSTNCNRVWPPRWPPPPTSTPSPRNRGMARAIHCCAPARYSELVREGPRPYQIARTARRIVAAVELARGPDLPAVAARLVAMGVARTQESGERSLAALQRDLQPQPGRLNNLYLHLTFRCQLECTHCYARADAHGHQQPDMPVTAISQLLREAKDCGFRQIILTGGEPLIHHDRPALLSALTAARAWASPMNLVLRTNFALPLTPAELRQLVQAVDQVVVSVDGDEASHDARRGAGSYAATLRNLEAYAELASTVPNAAELSLAAVLSAADLRRSRRRQRPRPRPTPRYPPYTLQTAAAAGTRRRLG